jgi:hypothetical protein
LQSCSDIGIFPSLDFVIEDEFEELRIGELRPLKTRDTSQIWRGKTVLLA